MNCLSKCAIKYQEKKFAMLAIYVSHPDQANGVEFKQSVVAIGHSDRLQCMISRGSGSLNLQICHCIIM